MSREPKPRQQQILEALALMLEAGPGARITTAALAREVGVSEAALYRHFPSKTRMFEGLIEFIEESVFVRVKAITDEPQNHGLDKCSKILDLVLLFAERNPGMCRILTGDALTGETPRLHQRIVQFYDRLESQIKQILREAELREGLKFHTSIAATSGLWLAAVEGRIAQYVRSRYRIPPSHLWHDQKSLLIQSCVSRPDAFIAVN